MPSTRANVTATVGGNSFFAGKNKIINGDFGINQRAFTSATTPGTYGFDRWATQRSNSSFTYSAQTFTPGTAPVAGYEGINFARGANTTDSTSGEYCFIYQRIEDVRTLAGQTATVSFWAKASSGTPKLGTELRQVFGSGGSSAVDGTGQSVTLSTSWARYSVTISVPSISGKTVGTSSYLELLLWFSAGSTYATRSGTVGNQSATIDVWGVQVEAGSVATAFQTATGTLQGELAACQRYYWRNTAGSNYQSFASGQVVSTTRNVINVQNPVPMRIAPTAVEYSQLATVNSSDANLNLTSLSLAYAGSTSSALWADVSSGLVAGNASNLRANNSTSAYLAFTAEL